MWKRLLGNIYRLGGEVFHGRIVPKIGRLVTKGFCVIKLWAAFFCFEGAKYLFPPISRMIRLYSYTTGLWFLQRKCLIFVHVLWKFSDSFYKYLPFFKKTSAVLTSFIWKQLSSGFILLRNFLQHDYIQKLLFIKASQLRVYIY